MSAWVREGEQWCHRPKWKHAINNLLRWAQPRAARKWLVYSRCTVQPDDYPSPPRVLGYGFGRVLVLSGESA